MNRLLGALSLSILAAACGGGSKGAAGSGLGDGGASYTATGTTQQFIDKLIEAYCGSSVRCGSSPDVAYCRDFIFGPNFISTASVAYSLDQGRTTRNASVEASCLQAIATMPCSRDSATSKALDAACQDLLVGTIASGGDCIDDSECKPGLECDEGDCTTSCCAGVCVAAKPLASVGGACTSSNACVDTAYCKQSYNSTTKTIEGTCQARAAVGAACTGYGSCVTSAECVGATGSQTCVALAKDGASCASSGVNCESSASYCDTAKGICQPRLKENAPCVLPDAGATAALSVGCLGYTRCKDGVCKRFPLVGQACSNPGAAALDDCFMVGQCVEGFCQADSPPTVCTVATAKAAAADAGARD